MAVLGTKGSHGDPGDFISESRQSAVSIERDSHMPVSLPTGVHRRGSTYHLRIGVPDDVRHLWPRRADGSDAVDAYRASLRTSDRNEAATKAHEIIADYRRQFDDLRANAKPAPLTPITDDLVAYIGGRIERDVLALDDLLRTNPSLMKGMVGRGIAYLSDSSVTRPAWQDLGDYLSTGQHEDITAIHSAILRGLKADMPVGRLDSAKRGAEAACAALTIRVDWGSPRARAALQKIMRALVKAWQSVSERNSGEVVETPEPIAAPDNIAPVAVSQAPSAKTLRDVVPLWQQHSTLTDNAIQRTARALALFEQAVGAIPLRSLEKSHGAAFLRFLKDSKARGFAAKTAHNHASAIGALMTIAVREDLIDSNPLDLTMDKSAGSKKREPWHAEDLNAIFGSDLFADTIPHDFPTWRNAAPQDGRVLLLLLAHTGARIGEIAQLRGEDFIVRNGVEAIRITAEAGTVKTDASERVVPLAEHLVTDAWFATWLDGARLTKGPALLTFCGKGTLPGDVANRWFRAFRDAVGLPDGAPNGAHRFRHWIRTELAAQHVTDAVADQITGHSAKGSAGRTVYTGTLPLATLKEALDRLPFSGATKGNG